MVCAFFKIDNVLILSQCHCLVCLHVLTNRRDWVKPSWGGAERSFSSSYVLYHTLQKQLLSDLLLAQPSLKCSFHTFGNLHAFFFL